MFDDCPPDSLFETKETSSIAQSAYRARLWAILVELLGRTPKAKSAASKLLGDCRDPRMLLGLSSRAIQRRSGCTARQAQRLAGSFRFASLCHFQPPAPGFRVCGPESAASLVRGLVLSEVERLWVVALDDSGEVLGIREFLPEAVDFAEVNLRGVFEFLLDRRAHSAFVAQNYEAMESGDRCFVAKLQDLGALLNLPIIDHITLLPKGYISEVEEGRYEV